MLKLIIGILVTWRLTQLLVNEDGPFDVFAIIRDFAGVEHDAYSRCTSDNFIGKMLCCIKCTSVWVGWAVALLSGMYRQFALVGLALSGGALLLERVTKK